MILMFTGTGNSAYVAKRVAKIIDDEVVDLKTRIQKQDFSEIISTKPWVVVAPVYAWQLPHVVRDWLKKAKLTGHSSMYFILTCGDSIGNAGHYAEKLCREIHKIYRGIGQVVMPENYIAMFKAPDHEKALEIVEKAEASIEQAAWAIRNSEPLTDKAGLLGKLSSGIVNKAFYTFILHSKKFIVDETKCTGCGSCVRNCPMNAITLENGKPRWHDPCTHCMACICHCPEEAIEYGRASKGQPRYTCPK